MTNEETNELQNRGNFLIRPRVLGVSARISDNDTCRLTLASR